jgi:nucleoside-diphosphate-sugar epimerase
MKILITGGAGYIGSRLVGFLLNTTLSRYLDQEGSLYDVTVYDNLMYNQTSLLSYAGHPRFRFVKGDIRDHAKLSAEVKKADKIIHLAAWVGAPICDIDPHGASDVNYDATKKLVGSLSSDQDIIFPMSNSGYGIGGEDFCTEESPLRPLSVYGKTKVSAEECVLNHAGSTTLRLATVFGPSPRPRLDLLVNDFTWRAWKEKCLVLFESHFRRNYIHVGDVCRTIEWFLKRDGSGEVYNVGLSDANLTKKELALAIQKVIPDIAIIESEIGSDPDKRDYIVSNEKLENTGWCPQYSIEDGIKELIEMFPQIDTVNYGLRNS